MFSLDDLSSKGHRSFLVAIPTLMGTLQSTQVTNTNLSSASAAGDKTVSNDAEDNVKVDVSTSPSL